MYSKKLSVAIIVAVLIGFITIRSTQTLDRSEYSAYIETTISDENSNEMFLAISVESAKVDYLLLIDGENNGFPRYERSEGPKGKPIALLKVSPEEQHLNLVGSRKAFKVERGMIQSVSIDISLNPMRMQRFIDHIRKNPDISRIESIQQI
ncbi:MAG: hypothetical protein GVY36_05860 [Verrucomicrobia bacterium]|jgi:hypothetical protein|nr:hypothetical protein [Verrucomicrobiota bacterium]